MESVDALCFGSQDFSTRSAHRGNSALAQGYVQAKVSSLKERVFFLEVVTGGNVYFSCGFLQLEVGVARLIPLPSCTACLSQTSPCLWH